jgi:glycosyltransferase involved in cell wall biosynthesis
MNKASSNKKYPEISILLPCLNEEASIFYCLGEIHTIVRDNKLDCEVIVIDNGSSDNSVKRVVEAAKVFPELILEHEPVRGYGSAYIRGLSVAHGRFIFMADMDGTYDFRDIPKFIAKLKEGYGVVVGNRFDEQTGAIMEKQSMPWHHRHIGNPFLSYLVRLFFGVRIRDIHCGMRAMTRGAATEINPHATGMEFASEMIVKAAKRNIPMTEIPVAYKKRLGESKLRSFADGWRHMRFLLLYSPLALFFIPGSVLFVLGSALMATIYFSSPKLFGLQFYVHPMFISSAMIMIGYQFIFFAGFARIYAATHLGDPDRTLERLFRHVTIEKAGTAGIAVAALGVFIYLWIFTQWVHSGFGALDEVKNSVVALTFIILGVETVSSAFMLSIVGIKEK